MSETVEAAQEKAAVLREPPGTAAEVPILPGFYPDPTICRVGPDYYLVLSTFEYFPGAPIFHSQDLLTWSQLGNVLNRRTQFRLNDARPSTGIYGSTLRHHAGRFWLATTNISDFKSGQLIVHADDPAGRWSEPVFVPGAVGIDPDLCWRNGQCYLTWKAMSLTFEDRGIRQAPLDLMTGELTRPPYPVWQGSGLDAAEAPHLYRVEDYWYLLLSEGGTERGHCVTVARARTPWGPFESCPSNPVFTHRSTVHPVQNVGHADLVQTAKQDWAAVYLGVRPRGSTPGFHVLGRETFLAGVDWVDGWPFFDERRFDVPSIGTGFADDFSTAQLDDRWVVPGGEPENVAVRHPSGGLELRSLPNGSPGLLCARVRDFAWTADATFSASGRFLLRLDDRHWYGLIFQDGQVRADVQVGDIQHEVTSVTVANSTVVLRIQSRQPSSAPVPLGNAGPDEIVLSLDDGEGFRELGRLDGRYVSTEVASGYTGRMLALGSTAARAHVLSFEYVQQHGQFAM
jgi:Glycosyl hydrolases family 43/Beta xylosidase C-terminal Concanavalin A-like domain